MILVYLGWIGYGRYRFHKLFKRATVVVFITAVITTQIAGLDYYKFRLGTEAVIPFSYTLDEHHEHSWEIFRFSVSNPFSINGTMHLGALNPSQRDRFNINSTWGVDILKVKLIIKNISAIDSGVYVWAVSQHAPRAKRLVTSYDARVDVIRPPGRVECDVRTSPYSKRWREVHCIATVGSDGGGQLICYQNSVKTPFQSAPEISATNVTAVFWMDAAYSISCCSHEANYEKDPKDCTGFMKSALSNPPSLSSVTRKLSTTPRIIEIIRTKKLETTPLVFTNVAVDTESTCKNVSLKQSNVPKILHIIYNTVYGAVICSIVIVFVIFVKKKVENTRVKFLHQTKSLIKQGCETKSLPENIPLQSVGEKPIDQTDR